MAIRKARTLPVHALILPFPISGVPEPLITKWDTFVIGDRLVRVIAERWRSADVRRVPWPCGTDPSNPDIAISLRAIDLATGEVMPTVSDAELCRLLSENRSPSPRRGA